MRVVALLRGVAAAAAIVVALLALAGPVGAAVASARQQSCDPAYGCPPPQPTPVQATCSLSVTTASPGDAVTAHIENVAPGTQVTLTFDGAAVGDAVADANGSAAVNWTVPSDASEGDHSVVFVGQSVYCDASADGFRVEAARVAVEATAGVSANGGPARSANSNASASSSPPAMADGTVGAAAGKAPVAPSARSATTGGGGGGTSPLAVAVGATAGVAAVAGGAQAARVLLRRRRLGP